MKNLLLSKSNDPFFNLALENYIFSNIEKEQIKPTLYLWCNSDVVVVGRFQNPWKECNLDKMEKDKVSLMRRDTGGGAVFHDVHNLCFTFVGSITESNYRVKNSMLVCTALASLGIIAEPSGRNDIIVNGAKISGAAFREKDGKYIHHGTVLIGTDLTRLSHYLNPDEKKLVSKGIQSVRSRVTNLATIDSTITVDRVKNALFAVFTQEKNIQDTEVQNIDIDFLEQMDALNAEYERLRSWDWRYGKSPEFTHNIEGRFDWGGIEISLLVKNAVLEDFSVYSDALDVVYIQKIRESIDSLCAKPYETSLLKEALIKDGFDDVATLC